MDVSRIRALRGPNLWSRNTAIEAIVRCSAEESDITRLPGFEARLHALFPAIGEHWPIDGGTLHLARVLEFAALALQAQAGCPVSYSRSTETIESGTYQVVVEYSEEQVGRQALTLAGELIAAARDGGAFDATAAVAQLRETDERLRLGPSTGSIVNAAVARGIPYRRLTDGSLVQFGWGSKQRRIQAAEVDTTSAVAESIAQDKELTKTLLQAAGVPVPGGPAGGRRRRRLGGGAADRPAGGGQAAARQPGQGRHRQRGHARAARCRLQGRGRDRRGDGRKVSARRRLPAAGGGQEAGGRGAARPAAGHRRRRVDGVASWSSASTPTPSAATAT